MTTESHPMNNRICDAQAAHVAEHGYRPNILEMSHTDSLALREECHRSPSFDTLRMLAPASEIDPLQDADGRTFCGLQIRVREGDLRVLWEKSGPVQVDGGPPPVLAPLARHLGAAARIASTDAVVLVAAMCEAARAGLGGSHVIEVTRTPRAFTAKAVPYRASGCARLSLPELNRRLLAERLDALVVVAASFDPAEAEQHFMGGTRRAGGVRYPSGSTVRILRGRPGPDQLVGYHLDLAVVLAPLEPDTLARIRALLVPRGGALFAPFAPEAS